MYYNRGCARALTLEHSEEKKKREISTRAKHNDTLKMANLSSPHPPLPPLLFLEPLDVQFRSTQHVRHLGLHGHGNRGGTGWVAGDGGQTGGGERGAGGKSGHLPSQRLVHGLALQQLGSDGGYDSLSLTSILVNLAQLWKVYSVITARV